MTHINKYPGALALARVRHESWGLNGDRVLEKLQGKLVLVRLADGTSIIGQLAGYTEYTLTLRCTDNVKLVNKGYMVTLELSKGSNGPATASG